MTDHGLHPIRRWEVIDCKHGRVDARFARVLVAYAHAEHQRAFFGSLFYVRYWRWSDLWYDRQPGNLLCRFGIHGWPCRGNADHEPSRGLWVKA